MKTSVFVGTSLDGFIARSNGDVDFLAPWEAEEFGYAAFMATVDALVIGRNTYDKVLTFDRWPYERKRVVVLSNRPLEPPRIADAIVERMAASPPEVLAELGSRGIGHVYVDGGITIQQFLREGLIERLIVSRVPVLIGSGIPLFGALNRDVRLRHVATRQYESGLVQSEYAVDPSG